FIMAITPAQSGINFLVGWIPSPKVLSAISHTLLELASVPLVAAICFMIYYFLPNGKVPFARVLPAAIAAGILTDLVRLACFVTLPMSRFREVYGPFALSVTLLFWAYVGAMILLFGAHLSAHSFVPTELSGTIRAASDKLEVESGALGPRR